MWLRCRINGAINTLCISIGLQELLIVLARHIDVNIVVPGDITLVAHRSDERTTRQEIAQTVSLAEAMDAVENAQLNLSQLVNIFYLSQNAQL